MSSGDAEDRRQQGDSSDSWSELDHALNASYSASDSIIAEGQTHTLESGKVLAVTGGFGPYKLVRRIGEGGMGEVWLAEQAEPVRRRVALKLVKLGMDTKQVMARFDSERQALALMSHPNVAAVYDAGSTDTGRPYFVMEFVPGLPITDYCDRERLTIRERLELFIPVGHAIQHAHQKGIIHRDIKPSNVLIMLQDGKPFPKVIDFGVAKATNQRLTEYTVYTEQGQFIGTPEYISPEQADFTSLDIDTRTDVYSLGVLLYELLAGVLPFDSHFLRRAGFAEIIRIIREVEPPKPSSRLGTPSRRTRSAENFEGTGVKVTDEARHGGSVQEAVSAPLTPDVIAAHRSTDPKSLVRMLKADLDWVAMKCLEKERIRRYETVNALTADIQRYLNDETIMAGPPSAANRIHKLIRRNRAAVLAVSIVAVALIFASALSIYWGVRAASASARESERAAELDKSLIRESELRTKAEKQEHLAIMAAERANEQKQNALLAQQASEHANQDLGLALEELKREKIASELARTEAEDGKRQALDLADEKAKIAQQKQAETLRANANADELNKKSQMLARRTQEAEDAAKDAMDLAARLQQELDRASSTRSFIENAVRYGGDSMRESERRLADALERAAGPDFSRVSNEPHLEVALHNLLGSIYGNIFNSDGEAFLRHVERANELAATSLEPSHPEAIRAKGLLSQLQYDMGREEEADALLAEVYREATSTLSETNPDRLSVELMARRLVDSEVFQGSAAIPRDELLPYLRRLYDSHRAQFGAHHWQTLAALFNLFLVQLKEGDHSILTDIRNARNASAMELGDSRAQTLALNLAVTASIYLENLNSVVSLEPLPEAAGLESSELLAWTYSRAKQELGWGDPITLIAAVGYGFALGLQGRFLDAYGIAREIPENVGDQLAIRRNPINYGAMALLGAGMIVGDRLLSKMKGELGDLSIDVVREDLRFYARGRRLCEQAVEFADREMPNWDVLRLWTREWYAFGLAAVDDKRSALALYEECLTIARQQERYRKEIDALGTIASLHEDIGQLDTSIGTYLEGIELADHHQSLVSQVELRTKLASLYIRDERLVEAEASLSTAVGLSKGLAVPRQIDVLSRWGEFLIDQERSEEAESPLRESIKLLEKLRTSTSPKALFPDYSKSDEATARQLLGDALKKQGRLDEALDQLEKAEELSDAEGIKVEMQPDAAHE